MFWIFKCIVYLNTSHFKLFVLISSDISETICLVFITQNVTFVIFYDFSFINFLHISYLAFHLKNLEVNVSFNNFAIPS